LTGAIVVEFVASCAGIHGPNPVCPGPEFEPSD